jgi:Integrase zinc binding domain/Chromo (CHRromatin Organisation MOdifier) domain
VLPDGQLRLVLLHDAHDAIIAGHLGIDKTYAALKRHFSWTGMQGQVAAYVCSCYRCQRNKASNQRAVGLLQPLEVPSEPWDHVSLDFVMSLPPSHGHDAILVVVDKLSKPPADIARGRKFAPKFAGPYNIVLKFSPVTYKLQLPAGTNAHPVFHSSLLRSYKADVTVERVSEVPELVHVEGQVEFAVERIIKDRRVRGKREFLVHWKGYSPHDATWEPLYNVDGSQALIEVEESRMGRSNVNPTVISIETGLVTVDSKLPF